MECSRMIGHIGYIDVPKPRDYKGEREGIPHIHPIP